MAKTDQKGKLGNSIAWVSFAFSLISAGLIIFGIIAGTENAHRYGICCLWIYVFLLYFEGVYSSKKKIDSQKLYDNTTISKITAKAKAQTFELIYILSIIACFVCSLVIAVTKVENPVVVGVYAYAVGMSVIMQVSFWLFRRQVRKHIVD